MSKGGVCEPAKRAWRLQLKLNKSKTSTANCLQELRKMVWRLPLTLVVPAGFSAIPSFFPFPFFFFFTILPSAVLILRTNSLPLFLLPVYTPTQDRPQNLPDAEKSCRSPYVPHTSQQRTSPLSAAPLVALDFLGVPVGQADMSELHRGASFRRWNISFVHVLLHSLS